MQFIRRFYAPLTGAVAFAVYLTTFARSVIQIDNGELAAVQLTLGIAHPTGYPLFTMLGFLFSKIPLPLSPITQMNLLASVYCAAAVAIFTALVKFLLDNELLFATPRRSAPQKKTRKRAKGEAAAAERPPQAATESRVPEDVRFFTASAAGLSLALNKTFWSQSVAAEVYSLHLLMIISVMYLLVRAFKETSATPANIRPWLLMSAALACSFSNHMTTLLILPGIAYLYFSAHGFTSAAFKRVAIMIGLFAVILLAFYSYLPLRANAAPTINWGNPVDYERIMRHVSGQQYRVWLFSSTDAAKKQLEYFLTNLPSEFTILLLPALAGVVVLLSRARKLFIFLGITFVFTVLYSINYDIHDIDSYFLLAYAAVAVFTAVGFQKIIMLLHDKKFSYGLSFATVLVFIAVQGVLNYRDVDESGNKMYEDYTKSALHHAGKSATIFSFQWDFLISPSYYFQFVEGYRKDVRVIDKELLRRSWYYHMLAGNYPALMSRVQREADAFTALVKPFEQEKEYNAPLLEGAYKNVMQAILREAAADGPVYIGPELAESEVKNGQVVLPEGYVLVPDNLLYRMVKGKPTEYFPASDPDISIRMAQKANYYSESIQRFAGTMLTRRAMYEMEFDKRDRARLYIAALKKNFPEFPLPDGLAEAIAR